MVSLTFSRVHGTSNLTPIHTLYSDGSVFFRFFPYYITLYIFLGLGAYDTVIISYLHYSRVLCYIYVNT